METADMKGPKMYPPRDNLTSRDCTPQGSRLAGLAARPTRLLLLMLLLLTLAALPAAAGARTASVPRPLAVSRPAPEPVTVSVLVTDRRGQPVTGLQRDDFTLLVNGDQVEITHFQPPPADPLPELSTTGPGNGAADPALQSQPVAERGNLIVLLDDAGLQIGSRRRALETLQLYLDQRRAGGWRISLVRYDADLQEWSGPVASTEQLRAGLGQLQVQLPAGARRFAEWLEIVNLQGTTTMAVRAQAFAEQLRQDSIQKLTRLNAFVKKLGQLPGRFEVLLVTDGIPLCPGEGLRQLAAGDSTSARPHLPRAKGRPSATGEQASVQAALTSLIDAANRAAVRLHALSCGGWRSVLMSSHVPPEVAAVIDANHAIPLSLLADGTGGQAIWAPTNQELSHLDAALDATYSLGFELAEGAHSSGWLEVETGSHNLLLRHRRTFTAHHGR